MKNLKKLWWGLAVLVLISPLGLILPELFKSGPAWGEWSLEEIEKLLGFVPEGIKRLSDFWSAPVPDYNLKSWEGQGFAKSGLAYIFSGVLGVGVIVLLSFFLGKMLARKNKP
jgi:predicted PurR-regulated permease PerM